MNNLRYEFHCILGSSFNILVFDFSVTPAELLFVFFPELKNNRYNKINLWYHYFTRYTLVSHVLKYLLLTSFTEHYN